MGSSKKQTIGYHYKLGLHLLWSLGPIDKITKFLFGEDKRVAWAGEQSENGAVLIDQQDMFGGKRKEGGVRGYVDVEFGASDQGRNAYLQSHLGNDIPAYRGLLGTVFRGQFEGGFYFGTSTYLKKIALQAQRIHVRQGGIAQWYDEKAAIGSEVRDAAAIYISLDISGSMGTVTSNGQTRLENTISAINSALDYILFEVERTSAAVDIMLVGWGTQPSVRMSIMRRGVDAADIQALKLWLDGVEFGFPYSYWTYFPAGLIDAPGFFGGSAANAKRKIIFITDGEPSTSDSSETQTEIAEGAQAVVQSIEGVESHAFNIDLEDTTYTAYVDNTEYDGVPVIDGVDASAIEAAIRLAIFSSFDFNPAHFIREALTDPDWGRGLPEADMGDSFTAAADVFFDEGMGISLRWDRQKPIEEFIEVLLSHCDAALCEDRKTGKFELKPIRFDYDPDTLDVLDKSVITKIDKPNWRVFGDLPTEVTVVYTDPDNGENASVTHSNPALAAMQGKEKGTTLQYPGFRRADLAARVAARESKALGSEIFTCDLIGTRALLDYNAGDVFKLTWPEYGISNMIVRVSQGPKVEGRNQVRLPISTDVYALPNVAPISPPVDEWEDPSQPPAATTLHIAVEAPYYELVQRNGEAATEAIMTENQDLGYILATAVRPQYAINASLWVDAGAGYEDSGAVDFCPYAQLAAAVGPTDTVWGITGGIDLDQVRIGSHAQLNGELVRIDAISAGEDQITVGRGVLDTVPVSHAAGSNIFFWDDYAESDSTEYVTIESIDVKVVPESGAGVADIADIAADTVVMNTRAFRPYPPGNLLLDSQAYPASIAASSFAASVAHRDRTQQTSGTLHDTTYGNIGPEAGVTYTWTLFRIDTEAVLQSFSGDSATSKNFAPGYSGEVRLEVKSVRDGEDSWQSLTHTFQLGSIFNRITESADSRITETGDTRVTE